MKLKTFGFVSCFVLEISCFAFLLFAPHVVAQGFVPLAPIPGLTDTNALSVANETNLASFFNNLYKYLIGIAAVLAIIMIIWGGLEISTQDSISKQGAGREKIKNAIFGLILVLSPVLVFSIINPSILNLSLNLPALDTTTKTSVQTTVSTTQDTTLSDTDKALRESAGGKVIFSFVIAPAEQMKMSARTLGQTLDTKQDECTKQTGGTGVLLNQTPIGGGVFTYICQTCPPNTTVVLFAKGAVGSGARGGCQPK